MDADTTMKKSANFIFHFDDQKSSVQTVKEKEESVKVKEESWSSIYEYHPSSCSSDRQSWMVQRRDSLFHKLEIYGDFKNESIKMESQIQQTDDKKSLVVENTFCLDLKDIDTRFSLCDLESTKNSFDDLKLLKQEYHRDENDLQQSKEAVDPACISSLKAKVEADVLNVYSREDEDTGSIKVTSPFIQRQIEPNYLKGESLIDQKPQAEGQLYPTDSMNGVSVLKKYSHLPKRSNECKKNKGNLRLDSRIDKENGPSDFGCVSRCTSKVNQEINCRSMIKTPSVRIIVKPHNKSNTQTHFGVLDQQENSNQSLCKKLFRTECSSQFNFYTEKLTNRPNYTGRTTDQSAVKPNQCGSRGKCFTRKSNLITQKNMHLVKPLTFDACKREFSRKVNLKEHENARITIKPFTCDVCEKGFTKRSSSRDHKKIHLAVKPYTCDVCQKGFTKKFNLKDHKKVHLAVHVKPYTCDVCQKSFAILVGLNNHKNMHLTVKPYKCEVCKKGFITRTNLKVHKNTHLAEKLYTCDVCEKGFTTRCTLNDHKNLHLGLKPYTCDVCAKSFSYRYSLYVHKMTHSAEKPYTCDVCEKGFSRKLNLEQHKNVHKAVKPYTCDVCQKGFTRKIILQEHKNVHMAENPFTCDVCKKGFTSKSALRRHTKAHFAVNPYTCNVCRKTFTTRYSLNCHKNTHLAVKPYTFDVGKNGFLKKLNLNQLKYARLAVKPFTCDVCKKRFTKRSSLRNHQKVHWAIKPYTCDVEKEMFPNWSTSVSHKHANSVGNLYTCDICNKTFGKLSNVKIHLNVHM